MATAMMAATIIPCRPNPPKAENGSATKTIPKSILRIEMVRLAMSVASDDAELFFRIIVIDKVTTQIAFRLYRPASGCSSVKKNKGAHAKARSSRWKNSGFCEPFSYQSFSYHPSALLRRETKRHRARAKPVFLAIQVLAFCSA